MKKSMQSNSQGRYWIGFTRFIAAAPFILAVLLLPYALPLPIDNGLKQWIDHDAGSAAEYEDFLNTFGSDELVIVAYSGHPIFSPESLDIQLEVLQKLEAIPNVTRISGIPLVYRELFGGENAEELEAEIRGTPFYSDFIISDSGEMAALILETTPLDETSARRDLVDSIYTVTQPLSINGWERHIVGPPVLNVTLDRVSRDEARRVLPIALVCSAAVLWIFLGSFRALAVALLCATMTLLFTVSIVGASHRSLNMVTTALPPLLWVLSLSNVVYLLRSYKSYRADGLAAQAAITAARQQVFLPCAVSALTTAFGFLSLCSAGMIPVQEFGVFAAIGLVVSLFVNFVAGPFLIRVFRVPPASRSRSRSTGPISALSKMARVSVHAPRRTIVTAIVLSLAMAALLPKIQVESNPLNFLQEDSDAVRAYTAVSEGLTGLYSLEMVIDAPDGWLDPALWERLENLSQSLEAAPGVARILSPLDFLKKLNQWEHDLDVQHYALPPSRESATSLLAALSELERAGLDQFVAQDGKSVRLSALVHDMNSTAFLGTVKEAERLIASQSLSGYTTGIILQVVQAQMGLIETLLKSLGIAFAIIFGCMLLGFASLRLMLLAIFPNVLPLFAAFTVMVLCNIPLDAGTVMMASIAMGIAVDDTVHIVMAYKRHQMPDRSARQAILSALHEVGPSITITTVTASIGFLALLRSEFVPLQHFGILATTALVTALLADVLLLPALLVCAARFIEGKGLGRIWTQRVGAVAPGESETANGI